MFNDLKYLLPDAATRAGIKKQLEATEICSLWEKALRKIFPAAIVKTQALSFSNRTLKVAVLGSVWAQELEFKKEAIVEFINKERGGQLIDDIRFEV